MPHPRSFLLPLVLGALTVGGVIAAHGTTTGPSVTVAIHWSRFTPGELTVPAGVPVTFVLRNDDPIDHEWIVGDATLHARHRTGTEPVHRERATEVSLPALTEVRTTITFDTAGRFPFICHLPGHEQYGMVGVVNVVAA